MRQCYNWNDWNVNNNVAGRKLKRWKEYLFRMDRAGAITYNPPAGPIKDKRRIPLRVRTQPFQSFTH